MNASAILNADMTTIGRWLRAGWIWWIDELAALLPARFAAPRGDAGGAALFDAESGVLRDLDQRSGRGGAPSLALVPAELCLCRTVELPSVGKADLRRMLTLDSDRVMPMAPGEAILAFRVAGRDDAAQRITVEVAAMPRRTADALCAAIALSDARIRRVAMQDASGGWDLRFDFLPALREAGLIVAARSAAARWWLVVAFLLALNVGLLIWRDAASVDRLAEVVDEQQPAVLVAQRIDRTIRRSGRLARESAARRSEHDALGLLGLVTRLTPDGAWVQRYVWDGATVRLAGYKSGETDMRAALRQSPRFADVHDAEADGSADIPAGQPFDIVAAVRPN